MLKIDRGVNALFLRQGLIVDLLDKVNHFRTGMEFPDRGFHTLLETQFETQDDYVVTWAWVTGGRGNGIKYTVAVATGNDDVKAGWVQGHKDYVFVRPVSPKFVNAIRHLTLEQLYLIGQISRFDGGGRHKDGWYSRGLFAARLALPDCLCADDDELVNQPEVWRIKEGVFILFPDATYRLMTFEEYSMLRFWDRPDYRQGDLMFHKKDMSRIENMVDEMVDEGETIRVDRHVITAQAIRRDQDTKTFYLFGKVRVEHPEHGVLDMPDGVYTYSLLPGTSRPFQGGID